MEQKPQGAEYLCERAKEDVFIPFILFEKLTRNLWFLLCTFSVFHQVQTLFYFLKN